MTNEYKENILKYITGSLQEGTPNPNPQFQDITSSTNNFYSQVSALFSGGFSYVAWVPSRNNNNQDSGYSVLVANGTLVDETVGSSLFIIIDKNYNIVQTISHYKNGDLIGEIECLNVDENGNFYGVQYKNSNYYIIELNNVTLKLSSQANYEAILKEEIQIPNAYTYTDFLKIIKDTSGDKYFALGQRSAGLVGVHYNSGNWNYYTTTYTKQASLSLFDNGFKVYWDSNGDLQFRIAVYDIGLTILSNGAGTVMERNTLIIRDDDVTVNNFNNFAFLNNSIGYFAETYKKQTETKDTIRIYKVDIDNDLVSLVYEQNNITHSVYNQTWLFENNNVMYYIKVLKTSSSLYTLTFGLINDSTYYETTMGTISSSIIENSYFCYPNVINIFNRNYIYIQNQNKLFKLNFLWNSINYNGTPYTGYGSLIPFSGGIEDENDLEIFNRNLYNLTSFGNSYTATIQIPNYNLNNETLYNGLLYSKNNNLMCEKTINTTKNIYEELNVNFINQFNIINEETNIKNYNAATYLVNSMLNSSHSAYISKYRINYHDNTQEIKNMSGFTINSLVATNFIVVYVNKKIDSIELLSDDETTTYQIINCTNLELNKYYKITQDIRIE